MKLTRCMTQKSFTHLILFNSAAIIGNANKTDSTIFDFHSNRCCFRINSIFQQLLYNRRWSVNNLSCCNLINRCLIEQLYFGHCRPPLYIFDFFIFDASHGLLRSFAALAILLSFGFADLLRKSLPSYFYIFDTSHGLLRSFAALAILLPFGFADLLRKSLPSSWECRFQAQI